MQSAEDIVKNIDQQKQKTEQNQLYYDQYVNLGIEELKKQKNKSQIKDQTEKIQYAEFFNEINMQQYFLPAVQQNANSIRQKSKKSSNKIYDSLFSNQDFTSNARKMLQDKLEKDKFLITQCRSRNQLNFKTNVVYTLGNFQVMEIFCQLGRYAKKYTIMLHKGESPRHKNRVIGSGIYGSIHCCQHFQSKGISVVKCLKFSNKKLWEIKNHINQFFICDMMSSLEIGPKVLRTNGFDFVIFYGCLEFEMQKCQKPNLKDIETELKASLLKMHILQIVHSDIKPANIMFSKTFDKNIFIDFGISQLLEEQICEKSLIKFRGTYEYSSEQMKQIFSKKDLSLVDLYSNDVEMLRKTFRAQNICLDRENELNKIFAINKMQKIKTIFQQVDLTCQILMEFKFHLYVHRNKKFINQIFQEFIKQFLKIKNYECQILLLKAGFQFAQQLTENASNILNNYIIKKNKKFNHILTYNTTNMQHSNTYTRNFTISKQQISNRKQEIALENDSKEFKIYQTLMNSQQKYAIQLQSKREKQKDKQNIRFILQNKSQIIKFKDEQYLQIFIDYCSFWKSSYDVDTKVKEQLAKTMREVIQGKQSQFNDQNGDDKYMPHDQNIKLKCKNLIFVYRYLLSYCMNGQNSQFKTINTLNVLKECIFLGFQYYYFLPQCFIIYFKRMIKEEHTKIITILFIEIIELVHLTNAHFLHTNNKDHTLYKNKYLMSSLQDTLKQLHEYSTELSLPQVYKLKLQMLLQIQWSLFGPLQDKTLEVQEWQQMEKYSIYRKIHQAVISQFVFNGDGLREGINNSEKAIKYVDCCFVMIPQSQKLRVICKSSLSINIDNFQTDGVCIDVFLYVNFFNYIRQSSQLYERIIRNFDNKISCHQISNNFYLDLRYSDSSKLRDIQKAKQILSHITSCNGSPSFNYLIYSLVLPQYFFLRTLGCGKQYLSNVFLLYGERIIQLIQIFSLQKATNVYVLKFLISLMGLVLSQSDYFVQLFSVFKDSVSKISLRPSYCKYEVVKKTVQMVFYKHYSLEYLKKRKVVFQHFLEIVKTCGTMRFMSRNTQNNDILMLCFRVAMCSNLQLGNQLVKYYQNRRIQYLLFKQSELSIQFQHMIPTLIKHHQFRYLMEIIGRVCSQTYYYKKFISLFKFHQYMRKLSIYDYARQSIYQASKQYILQLKSRKIDEIYLFPFLIHLLSFKRQIPRQSSDYKYFLIKLFSNFQQYIQPIQQHDQLRPLYRQQIYYYSISFISINKKCRRKQMILLRQLIKCGVEERQLNQYDIQQLKLQFMRQTKSKDQVCPAQMLFQTDPRNQSQSVMKSIRKARKKETQHQNVSSFKLKLALKIEQKKQNYHRTSQLNQSQFIQKTYQIKSVQIPLEPTYDYQLAKFFYKYDSQFSSKFGMKDLYISSEKQDCLAQFFSYRYREDAFGVLSTDLRQETEKKIYNIKKTERSRITEETVDIIDQIILTEKNTLMQLLKRQKSGDIEQINWVV